MSRREACSFATWDEESNIPQGQQGEPALIINPKAPPSALLGAALARVDRARAIAVAMHEALTNGGDLSVNPGLFSAANLVEVTLIEAQMLLTSVCVGEAQP